jgi:hypothetical protein
LFLPKEILSKKKEKPMNPNAALNEVIPPLTIFREARGEEYEVMVWIAWVIHNRSTHWRWPDIPWKVCVEPKQFSVWNPANPNINVWPTDQKWRSNTDQALENLEWALAQQAWDEVEWEIDPDPTNGANHYHSYKSPFPLTIRKQWSVTAEELKSAYVGSKGKIHAFKF